NVCDLTAETCECVDCFGRPGCLPCIADSVCGSSEPCYCPECKLGNYCIDPKNCHDDGICDAAREGGECADCAPVPECKGAAACLPRAPGAAAAAAWPE